MIVVLLNSYIALLALFVWLKFIPFNSAPAPICIWHPGFPVASNSALVAATFPSFSSSTRADKSGSSKL